MTQPTPNNLYPVANALTSSLPFIEVFKNRNPSTNDVNYQIQQRWWNTNSNVEYVLVGFTSTGGELKANWQPVSTGAIVPVETFTADTGGVVSSIGNNINLFTGDGVITTAGNPVSATITVELTGVVTPAHGGTGVINPPAHTIPIAEGSSNFNFLGPMMSGQTLIGSTGLDPVVANLTAGAGIMITNGPGSITIASTGAGMGIQAETGNSGGPVGPDGSNNLYVVGDGTTINVVGTPLTNTLTISTTDTVATTYNANAGFAVPAAGVLNILGSTGVTTSGGGSTITVTAAGDVATTYDADAGSATPSANVLTISGGATGLTTTGAGSTIDLTGTLVVAHGGTGDTSFTAYAPITGGTSSTGALQSASTGLATAGFVLTSNGAAALPSFQSIFTTNTYTPVLSFGGASVGITYSTQFGKYTVIGNMVFYSIFLVLTNKGSSVGTAFITLPFTAANITHVASGNFGAGAITYADYCYTSVVPNTNSLELISSQTGILPSQLTNGNFSNNSELDISGFYFTS